MRNRTALTTAVTSSAPRPESRPAQDDLVFGKVAGPGGDGTGARVQDVELFDVTLTLPRIPGEDGPHARHGAGKPRHVRKASRSSQSTRSRGKATEREKGVGVSLPLLVAGALAAGFGLTVGLTSGPDHVPPDSLTLTMPDLPPPSATPTPVPPATPTTPPTTAAAPPRATTAPPTPSSAPSSPRTPTRTSTPPPTQRPTPPPIRSSRPSERPVTDGLRLGSTGSEVEDLQYRLQQLYLYLGSADGTYSESVEAALIRFQASRAIPEERGVYGPLTRAALHAETDRNDRTGGSGGSSWGGDVADDSDGSDGWNDDDRTERDGWGG
ncbi:peptidoglycan-binding domain-containing protein [Streptomyces sp. NPDC018338]|uniref:peptidoglycan-binding domain-containing protein n=1 Tax=Streptomyces sp. NPDC018338 TaxID=3157192 RepID=UPI0033E4D371